MRTFARFAALVILSSAWGCGSSGGEGTDIDLSDGGDDDATSGADVSGRDVALPDGGIDGFILPDSPSCKPKTCAELGTNCGPVADGCGGIIASCGTCTAPEFCGGGGASICGKGDTGCVPKTCADLGATCGKQGDGCGALIDCGTCTAPATCGGGGVLNTCGIAGTDGGGPCVPKTCAAMGLNCGPTADGCGGLALCGTCTVAGESCGGGGKPNVCGGGVPTCIKKTCADWGANCGPVADGCGGLTATCGACTLPDTCGGGGTPSVCGGAPPVCTPKTCTDFPGTCGPQPDGCGGLTTSCGTCVAPQTCGGGGVPSVCGGGAPPCTPKTCADFTGKCGVLSDGCGGLTANCGTCTAPAFCGGGGTPSVCGGGTSCVPKKCTDFPAGTCGKVADGCGGLTADCGTCTAPAFCGGGGPSLCGITGGTTCVNLACKQVACTGTATTSISGVVYDPAGLHPLPNVNVYVPNSAVSAITSGATCDACSAGLTGTPLVKTTTDVNGKFLLKNMPVDTNVPVVIQLGKWRRQITVTTSKCVDTVVAAGLSRFPRNKSEGDIPKIALTTGNADPLECLLRKIGIDDTEFTNPTGTGRVNLFDAEINGGGTHKYSGALGGATFPDATQLWNSLDPITTATPPVYGLRAYDVVLLGCEGTPTLGNKSAAALKAMQDYTNVGGRVFAEHYHYQWMLSNTTLDAPSTKTWSGLVTWSPTASPPDPSQETVLRTFPKAITMSDWMMSPAIKAANVPPPSPSQFPVSSPRHSIGTIKDTTNVLLWVQTVTGAIPQYFTFDTPIAPATGGSCGRFVFSDIHVSSGDTPDASNFPGGCTTSKTSMTPQELALEFMFFDLASPVCGGEVPPPTCTPTTCTAAGVECGGYPDGCGGTLSCGTCTAPLVCSTGGKCAGSSCTPATCASLGFTCGSWADGCGGALSCGTCTAPLTCGGGGTPGTCGGASCTPTTCAALGHDCGTWADGCGGTLSCGTCVAPATCGGGGVPGSCGGTSCTPKTCAGLGYTCGSWVDGCGGVLSCGTCVAPDTCGGGGVPGTCGSTGCTPKTCTALGITCGPAGDGCGGAIDCGPCPDSGTTCVPLTCGGRCGPQGDGCGGILTCPACDGGICIPTTCAAAGAECGSYPDGCGGLLNCGSCVAPQTCGGGGVANKCGGVK